MSTRPADSGIERPLLVPEDVAFDSLAIEPGSSRANLALLSGMWQRGRLPHALLLAGPRGTGKRHCAVRLAQLLACEAPRANGAGSGEAASGMEPCMSCLPCTHVERGIDSDLILLEPLFDDKRKVMRGEIAIDQVRNLIERLTFRSSGGRRVILVDPADRLSPVAQEALLKTLEEPPQGVTILLLTSRPSALKPTIRSRAQIVRFTPASEELVAQVVAERAGRSMDDARLAAALSGGDLRRALSLDPALAARRWTELARALYLVLGARGEAKARDLAIATVPRKGDGEGGEEPSEGVPAFLTLLEQLLVDVLRAGGQPGEPSRLLHPGGEKASSSLAQRLRPEAAAEALGLIEQARRDLDLHCSAKLVLTHMLLAMHELARGDCPAC